MVFGGGESGVDKGLGWGGGTEARTRCGDMFINPQRACARGLQ